MEVHGVVVSWQGGLARVQVAPGACVDCAQHCPARSMARPGLLLADAPEPLTPGQAVRLEVNLPSPARAATLAFGLPCAGLLAGLFAGSALFGGHPLGALAGGLTGMAAAFAALAAIPDRKRRCHVTPL
jgi:positive regulator of sigma E activity